MQYFFLASARLFNKVPQQCLENKLHHYLSETRTYLGSKVSLQIGIHNLSFMGRYLFLQLLHLKFHRVQYWNVSCSWCMYTSMTCPQVSSSVRLSADDCLLCSYSRPEGCRVTTERDYLQEWERNWQMVFNPDKCEHTRVTNE